jgi:hypothetical protein
LGHAGNPDASINSIIGNSLSKILYILAFLGSKNIWFPISLHFSWNAFQTLLFGFPVSGIEFSHIIHQSDIQDSLFSGGNYGPEAGIIGIIFRFLIILMVIFYLKHSRRMTIKSVLQ